MSAQLQSTDPAASQATRPPVPIALNIELSGAVLIPPASQALLNIIRADIVRALESRNLLALGDPDPANSLPGKPVAIFVTGTTGTYAYLKVHDLREALAALQEELTRTGLIEHTEIGWLCFDELIWRRYWPKTDYSPFIAKILSADDCRVVNTKLLATLNFLCSFDPQRPPP